MPREMKLFAILLAEKTDKYFKKELEIEYPFFVFLLDNLSFYSYIDEYGELSCEKILSIIVSECSEDIDFIYKKLCDYYFFKENEYEE